MSGTARKVRRNKPAGTERNKFNFALHYHSTKPVGRWWAPESSRSSNIWSPLAILSIVIALAGLAGAVVQRRTTDIRSDWP